MRLENHDQAPVWPPFPGSADGGGQFRGMVAIILDGLEPAACELQLAEILEPPFNTLETLKAAHGIGDIQSEFPGDGEGTERIADVVKPGQIQGHRNG